MMHLGGGSSLLGLSSQSLVLYNEICYQTWLAKETVIIVKSVLEEPFAGCFSSALCQIQITHVGATSIYRYLLELLDTID